MDNNGISSKLSNSLTVPSNRGSATGNPRNKCALKPGHSLMHWIRLGQSGKDLTGIGGCKISVTLDDLAKHNTRHDAWLAIHGNVYNVTPYMDYHPGGVEELMRGVGKDATQLFTDIHSWVNYQQLLQKCCVGTLKLSTKLLPSLIEENSVGQLNEMKGNYACRQGEIIPHFDWKQTSKILNISLYTNDFSNPGFVIRKSLQDNNLLELWVLLEQTTAFKLKYNLHGSIEWPPKSFSVNHERGVLEVNFNKSLSDKYIWSTMGNHQIEKLQNSAKNIDDEKLKFHVIQNYKFNRDSWQLSLKCNDAILITPLGYHVNILAHKEVNFKKPYTPVPHNYLYNDNTDDSMANNVLLDSSCISFLYKNYFHKEGFSSYLSERSTGDILGVSLPQGHFILLKLAKHRRICFLAAGSGITPFLGLINHLLKRRTNRIELLCLYYFNKTYEDIWCYNHLEQLTRIEKERFQFVPVLTTIKTSSSLVDRQWAGLNGSISKDTLQLIYKANATFIAICGPQGFNAKIEEIIKELQFPTDNFYIF